MLIFWQFMIQFSRVEMSGLVAKKWGKGDDKGNTLILKEKVSFIFFIIFNYRETSVMGNELATLTSTI